MATSRGRRNFSYPQPPFSNQRPGQGSILPNYPAMQPQGGRAPLISTNPVIPFGRPGLPTIFVPQPVLASQRPHFSVPFHQNPTIYQRMPPIAPQMITSKSFVPPKGANSVGYQNQSPPFTSQAKRKSNAIKIIDPSTQKEVSMDKSEPASNSSVSIQPVPSTVVEEFQHKVQGSLISSDLVRNPNAIISNPGTGEIERDIEDLAQLTADSELTEHVLGVQSPPTCSASKQELDANSGHIILNSAVDMSKSSETSVAQTASEEPSITSSLVLDPVWNVGSKPDIVSPQLKDNTVKAMLLEPLKKNEIKATVIDSNTSGLADHSHEYMSTAAEKHPKRSPTPKKVKHEIGKSDIDGSRSKPNQDKMKTSDGIKQRVEENLLQTFSEKCTSLLSEPVQGAVATCKTDDDLEEGEIPPGDEMIINGDAGNAFDLADHEQRKYDRNFLLEYRRLAGVAPYSLRLMPEVYCPGGVDASGSKKVSKPFKKVIDHRPQALEKVELHKAEKRWVRSSDQNVHVPENEKEDQELFRRFQGILNKLTPQKFTNLAVKAQALEIDTERRLHGCIDKIFEKALEEPSFSIAYANLCRVMSNIRVDVSRLDEEGVEVPRETSFRRELLTKCQKEFEKDKRDDDTREIKLQAIASAATEEEKKQKQEAFDVWETLARRRSLGNIRFIGELFKLKMLSEGIMHDCILRLLRSTSDHESLECFCRLITTTGKELDHPQAKIRMDRYFERISEIIEKKKVSSRIKFMLQDVQDLRKCEWVPRRQEGLKTIDQIHEEAKIEAMAEQEMIKHMAVTSNKSFARDEKKKGGKGVDDLGGRKFDKRTTTADVNKILGLRKNKEVGSGPSLGPGAGLRPSGTWGSKKKDGPSSTTGDKERVPSSKSLPQKSSSSGSKRQTNQPSSSRIISQGPRRSSSQPNEKQSVLEALKGITNQSNVPVKKPAVDRLDEDTVRRKTSTIVDEFAENKDSKEAVDCIIELESPGLMNAFVAECILHTLEKSRHHREYAGQLLEYLVVKSILLKEKVLSGLKEVIEMADDLEVDIPKFWDFLAEILSPLFLCECLTIADYHSLFNDVGINYKTPKAVSRLLQQCVAKSSRVETCNLWKKCELSWKSLGLDDNEEDFIAREKLQFLSHCDPPVVSTFENPHYFRDLVVMFGRPNISNDEILGWIESQKFKKDHVFVRSLSRASVEASVQGEGDNCIIADDKFRNRLPIVKKWVDENEELQIEVLNAMQVSMDWLKHPPGLLSTVFWSLYDVEVVSEKACYEWNSSSKEIIGRGMALQTTKQFFDWLDTADQESDMESNS